MEEVDVMSIVMKQISERFCNITEKEMELYIDKILLEMKKAV